ncbi:MAG: P-loop NTPase fold protein [Candidatus Binataceae bacterium]
MWSWKKKKEVAQEEPQSGDATGGNRISPDSPVTDPGNDLLGHAPFAKSRLRLSHATRDQGSDSRGFGGVGSARNAALATSISKMSPAEGLVMALHGPWGSGKTTILNFVEYYLAKGFALDIPPEQSERFWSLRAFME